MSNHLRYFIIYLLFVAFLSSTFAQNVVARLTTEDQIYLPLIVGESPPKIVIAAAYIDSVISHEPDEAILLWNLGPHAQSFAGWRLSTATRQSTFPITSTLSLAPGDRLWCTNETAAFRISFGEDAACEWGHNTDPSVLNLDGALQLTNVGGVIHLQDGDGTIVDTLLYGEVQESIATWQGRPAVLYARGSVPSEGQVWQRKRDPNTDLPIDSDQAADWAGDLTDIEWGRRIRMPGWRGWERGDLAVPESSASLATVTVAVGPEGLYRPLVDAFASATRTLDMSLYTFEHPELTETLVQALNRGVRIRMLLEGGPPGGIDDVQRWCVAQIAAAGGDIRYLAAQENTPKGYRPRYRFTHAKYIIIDGSYIAIGTENFSLNSMPLPQIEPVGGRRGFYLLMDAIPVVQSLQHIFDSDWAPERFLDLRSFRIDDEVYGGPPSDFVLPEATQWEVVQAPFSTPVTIQGYARFGVMSAPENALRSDSGLLNLIHQAGVGDNIQLIQLYERKHWGETVSNPIADPNPRLLALIESARRGASVKILLDSFFDDSEALHSNRATVDYIRQLAEIEGLDIEARVGNPTAGGIHAKVMLAYVNNERWTAIGSLNGGEVSHKLNREVVVLTDMEEVYDRIREVFQWDWARADLN